MSGDAVDATLGPEYRLIRQIGQGAFGRALLVERAVEPNAGDTFVIKQINVVAMGDKARREAEQEVKVLAHLKHPYIIGYMTYFIVGSHLNIVLEYAAGGDLSQRIKRQKDVGSPFAEDDILVWFAQISSALAFVHSQKILHRDIKAQNIFLTQDSVAKLGDFGIAKVLGDTYSLAQTVIGTPYYMSPELCENAPYNYKSDVWAMGCVLYELAALKHAFEGANMCALILKILRGRYDPLPDCFSPDLRELVDCMLQSVAADRPMIADVLNKPIMKRALALSVAREETAGAKRLMRAISAGKGSGKKVFTSDEAPGSDKKPIASTPDTHALGSGDPRGILLSDAPAFRPDPSKRRTSGLRTENVIDLSSDSSTSSDEGDGVRGSCDSDASSAHHSGDGDGFGLATAEIPTLRMDDTLPPQAVNTKSKSRPSIQAAVLFRGGAKQAFVEDVATAVVVESPAPVSVGLPPSAAELRSRAQRQARVTPEPLITAEFPSGVGVAIGEVQSETESDYTNDHDEEEYSADHEAESPSSHQKPLRVWGNVVAPLKVTSELLSPTGDVAPVMEPLAVDEYSADDFVPEEEAVDPVEALLQSAPAVLNDFEVTEATLPPHEPYKPIGLPPPPRFPQPPPSSTHSAPESIPAPPKQPPPPLPKSRPPPPPVPPSVPGARVSPKVTPTATPKAPIPLLDEVSPEKVDLPTKAVIPPPPPPPPVPPSVVSLSPASSPGTRVSLRTPRLGLASPTIGSIAGTVSTHPESGQGSATTSSPAVPQTVTVTPLEPEAYASDASSHSDGNSTSADELPVGHPPRHHTDFTEESSVEEEDNLSPASDADSQHSSDVHSVATSVDDSDTSVILDDLSSRLSSFTDASESAIARASAMGPSTLHLLQSAQSFVKSAQAATVHRTAPGIGPGVGRTTTKPTRTLIHAPAYVTSPHSTTAQRRQVTVPVAVSRPNTAAKPAAMGAPPPRPKAYHEPNVKGTGTPYPAASPQRTPPTLSPTEVAAFLRQKVDALYGTHGAPSPRKKSPAVTVSHLSPEVEAAKRNLKAAKEVERARSAAEHREHVAKLKRAQAAPSKLKDSISKQKQQGGGPGAVDTFYSDSVTLEDLAGSVRSGGKARRDIPVEVFVAKEYEKLLDDLEPTTAPTVSAVPHHRRLLTGSKSSFSKSIKRIAEGMERLEAAQLMAGILGGSKTLTPDDSMDSVSSTGHMTVEALRQFCEDELGVDNFKAAYAMLMDSDRLSTEDFDKLAELAKTQEILARLTRLVTLEKKLYGQ